GRRRGVARPPGILRQKRTTDSSKVRFAMDVPDHKQERYLDLDSTHRIRSLYPNPCDFVVPVGLTDQSVIQDPVLLSAPYTGSLVPIDSNYTQVSPDEQHIALGASEPDIENFYAGDTLEILGEFHGILEY